MEVEWLITWADVSGSRVAYHLADVSGGRVAYHLADVSEGRVAYHLAVVNRGYFMMWLGKSVQII